MKLQKARGWTQDQSWAVKIPSSGRPLACLALSLTNTFQLTLLGSE